MSGARALLFAVAGTTCRNAMTAYCEIEGTALRRFPGVTVRWTYTSAPIRKKLAACGTVVESPEEALQSLQSQGVTQVAVVALHLLDGAEYRELAEVVLRFSNQPDNRMRVGLTPALLTRSQDWERALRAMMASLPGVPGLQDRVVLVVHGSLEPHARATLETAGALCRKVDSRLVLGMMLGAPGRDDVVRECRERGVRKVWLVPCLVVAGLTAVEEVAGSGATSWATALQQAGIEVVSVVRGLGEIPGVVEVWLDQVKGVLNA